MRAVSPDAAAVLAGSHVPMAVLIEMDLASGAFNLNTSNLNLTIGGTTYYGTKGLGKVAALADSPADISGLSFELSGVPSDLVSLALSEPVQGRAVRLKLAVLHPGTYAVLDVHQRWVGRLDAMSISEQGGTAVIAVTAEHIGIDLARPASSLYSDAEQQRLHPGDLFLQFMADQVEQRIVWPSRQYFQQ